MNKIVDQISPETILFLINAIYSKGNGLKDSRKERPANRISRSPMGVKKLIWLLLMQKVMLISSLSLMKVEHGILFGSGREFLQQHQCPRIYPVGLMRFLTFAQSSASVQQTKTICMRRAPHTYYFSAEMVSKFNRCNSDSAIENRTQPNEALQLTAR
jgi:hypothetical protein